MIRRDRLGCNSCRPKPNEGYYDYGSGCRTTNEQRAIAHLDFRSFGAPDATPGAWLSCGIEDGRVKWPSSPETPLQQRVPSVSR